MSFQTIKYIESKSTKVLPKLHAVRKDRAGDTGGGGLATFFHHSISSINIPLNSLFPSDDITEHLSITATINNVPINIDNIYIPSIFSYSLDFTPNFHLLFNFYDINIIMGDFNVHSPAWYSRTTCTRAEGRGILITKSLKNSDLILLNIDSPTRVLSCRDTTLTRHHNKVLRHSVKRVSLTT